jgi:hypothetical protein
MDNSLTEIVFILDRSGSMGGLENDTIGGFNGFVKKQSEIGRTNLTTVLFDNKYEILHNGIDAKNIMLTNEEYFTRGSTALLDAVGKSINDVGMRLGDMSEETRPGKVIFVITTDGLENASREYSYDDVNRMITHQREKYNWEFIFMGANIDVAKEGAKLGIVRENTFAFDASPEGVYAMCCEIGGVCEDIRTYKPKKKKQKQHSN